MYDFLLQTILFASLSVIVYLFARAIPRVDEVSEPGYTGGRFDKLLARLPLREIDARVHKFFQKALRRVKVIIMKSDNIVDEKLKQLGRTRVSSKEQDERIALFEKQNDDITE